MAPAPTVSQLDATRAVVEWYLRSYFRTPFDVGTAEMFCRAERVGHFAVAREELAAGAADALFRLLVTVTMFQRRSDLQIMRVLLGIEWEDALEITNSLRLLNLVDGGCELAHSLDELLNRCDLGKCPDTKRGVCGQRPNAACHLKRHTELLKRYGHFGKMPTSVALMLRAEGVSDLPALRARVWDQTSDPHERAVALESAISGAWRISEKIAAMYLSIVTNRDLSGALAPWADGIDTDHYVVIDSNVDLFLKAIEYGGPMTYRARREFVQAISHHVHLDQMSPGMTRYNPRVVQQALYMFMSESNRRANPMDCSKRGADETSRCPTSIASICPFSPGRCAANNEA